MIALILLLPFLAAFYFFFVSPDRLVKVECVFAAISILFIFAAAVSYRQHPTLSIAWGLIAAVALLVIGLIELKRYDNRDQSSERLK